MTKLVKMKAIKAFDIFACRFAHKLYRVRRSLCSVIFDADKGYFLVKIALTTAMLYPALRDYIHYVIETPCKILMSYRVS